MEEMRTCPGGIIGMLKRIFIIVSALAAVGLCLFADAFSGLAWLWMLPAGFAGCYILLILLLCILILIMTACVDMDKSQEKDNAFYRAVVHGIISVAVPLLRIRIHNQGFENKPEGKCLVVCNHLNDLDPAFIFNALPEKKLAFISKREVDDMFVIGKFLHKLRGQPINRENDREALKTILNCIRIIKENDASVAVFPEGYVSMDKKLHPLRHGVFKIAQRAGVPIVVCTLRNTHHIFSNVKRLKPTDVYLHMVGVIPAEELKGVTAVEIGERVYNMMAEDLGPELVLQIEN